MVSCGGRHNLSTVNEDIRREDSDQDSTGEDVSTGRELLSSFGSFAPLPLDPAASSEHTLIPSEPSPQHSQLVSEGGTTSGGVLTPESQCLPSGASASFLSRHLPTGLSARKLNFDEITQPTVSHLQPSNANLPATAQASTNYPVGTSAGGNKSCLRKPESPQKAANSNLTVSFSESHQLGGQERMELSATTSNEGTLTSKRSQPLSTHVPAPSLPPPTVSKFAQKLDKVLSEVREEFGRYSRLSCRSGEESMSCPTTSVPPSTGDGDSPNTINDQTDLERMKRLYCEKKIHGLHQENLRLEERLAVSETLCTRQRESLEVVGSTVRELTEDFETRERQRMEICQRVIAENVNLQGNIALAQNFAQTSAKRSEELDSKVKELNGKLEENYSNIKLISHQNDSLTTQNTRMIKEKDELHEKAETLEKDKWKWMAREEKLTKELLAMEKELKRSAMDVQRVRVELAAEKSSHKLGLEHKEREFKCHLESRIKDVAQHMEEEKLRMQTYKERELSILGEKMDMLMKDWDQKEKNLTGERDEAQQELKHLQQTLKEKENALCSDIQNKLANKYRELLSEFGKVESPRSFPTYASQDYPQQGQQAPLPGYPFNYPTSSLAPQLLPQQSSGAFQQDGQMIGQQSLAEEFWMQMQDSNTAFSSPQRPGFSNQPSPLFPLQSHQVPHDHTRKVQLQGLLKQVMTSKSHVSSGVTLPHPSDPGSRR